MSVIASGAASTNSLLLTYIQSAISASQAAEAAAAAQAAATAAAARAAEVDRIQREKQAADELAAAQAAQTAAAAVAPYNAAKSNYVKGIGSVADFAAASATAATAGAISSPGISAGDNDARMAFKAASIAKSVMDNVVGISSTKDMRWDVSPVGAPDGVISLGDAMIWQRIASGERLWSTLGLPAFAGGGIATAGHPSIFGEGSMNEAAIPLPDGRTVPVTLSGSSNQEIVEELKTLRKEITELQTILIKITSSGFVALVSGQKEGNNDLKEAANTSILAKRRVG
jgi:hypothetical protein